MVRFVHKISPSDKDLAGPILLGDNAFSNKNTLAAALRKTGILSAGSTLHNFRVEGDKVIAFPGGRSIWHSIILTPA